MKRAVCLFASALLASALPWAYGQAGNPDDLQQKLNAAFKITTMTANMADIATAGDVVELHKGGLIMYGLASPMPPSNTYKNGKIGQGWAGFGKDLTISLLTPGTGTSSVYPQRIFVAGEKCWVLAITVQNDGVLFKLYGDSNTYGLGYYANLKFPFSKKQAPPADALLQTVGEVLTVVPSGDQGAQPDQGGPMAAVAGEYLFEMTGTRYVLLPNGSCFIRNPGGTQNPCQFIIDGDWIRLTMKIGNTNVPIGNFKIQGDKLYMNGTVELVRQGVPPAPAPQPTDVAPPTPAAHQYDALEAPPTPPAPAPTITIGEHKAQVITDFGEPQRKAAIGQKEIYFYTDLKMKVTFVNGKVSSID